MLTPAAQEPVIPAVIRIEGGTVNWWAPVRSGDDAGDYLAGAKAFRDARAMAAHGIAFGLLCSFIAGMRKILAYELGFLDALAAVCIACPAPCLYTDDYIAEQVEESGWAASADMCRQGNLDAWSDRQADRAERIVRELMKFILQGGGPSSAAYVHSI